MWKIKVKMRVSLVTLSNETIETTDAVKDCKEEGNVCQGYIF